MAQRDMDTVFGAKGVAARIKISRRGGVDMKRPVLIIIVMLLLQSCAWTYRLNPLVGKRFEVQNVTEVVFYEGPSLNSASFYLEKPERFVVVIPTCPEGKFSCNIQALKDPFSIFYKIRFDSGKEAYINYKHFDIVEKSQPRPASPAATKDSMICEPIWWKKDSFRCRME